MKAYFRTVLVILKYGCHREEGTHTHTGKIKANFIRPGPLINKEKKKKGQKLYCKIMEESQEINPFSISCFSSVQFSHSVVSNSLRHHGLQHARLPCPLPSLGVYSNSCPLTWWCHPAISSSVVPFSSHPQSFPASGSFQMSQLFTSGGQSIGASASTSVLPMNTQEWSPLEWTGWITLRFKGLSRVFSNTTVPKHQFLSAQLSL